MSIVTFEGVVDENGSIQLTDKFQLPRYTKVYVVIPDSQTIPTIKEKAVIYSPRLAKPEDAADFVLEVVEDAL